MAFHAAGAQLQGVEPALASAALNPLSKTEGACKEWERISFSHWNPQLNLGSLHIGICDCFLVSQLEHQESVFPDLSTIVCDKANDLMLSAFIEVNILTDRKMGHWENNFLQQGSYPPHLLPLVLSLSFSMYHVCHARGYCSWCVSCARSSSVTSVILQGLGHFLGSGEP